MVPGGTTGAEGLREGCSIRKKRLTYRRLMHIESFISSL